MSQCPACAAPGNNHPIHVFSAGQAAQHFVLAEEYPKQHAELCAHIESLWGAPNCEIHECPSCGLRYAWPFVAGDGRFYNLAYPHSEYPEQRWEFDQTAASLAKDPPPGSGRVLEIGSGFGYFLRKISPALIAPERVVAVEYNDVARSKLKQAGYTAYGEDVRSTTFDAYLGQVSTVFLFQVLEHMDDLEGVMRRLNELLQPGGRIYVAVPNAQRIEYNETHGSLFDMPPNHVSRWTESALRAFAARGGWDMQDFRVEPLRWRDLVRGDLVFSHMQRAQRSGSVANRLRARQRSGTRVAAEGALAVLSAPSRFGAWYDAYRSDAPLGDSIWAQFRAR
jgi:SAM-dependent methyltransferase